LFSNDRLVIASFLVTEANARKVQWRTKQSFTV